MNEKKVLVFDTKVNVNNLAKQILRKEKEIIRKYPPSTYFNVESDGDTGLGVHSLTSRFNQYNVLDWWGTAPLRKDIISRYKIYYPDYKGKVEVRCWANVLRQGEEIKPHQHYPVAEEFLVCGNLVVKAHNTNTYYEGRDIRNINGQLILFEPTIVHWTDKCQEDVRITIGFDIMPKKRKIVTLTIR